MLLSSLAGSFLVAVLYRQPAINGDIISRLVALKDCERTWETFSALQL